MTSAVTLEIYGFQLRREWEIDSWLLELIFSNSKEGWAAKFSKAPSHEVTCLRISCGWLLFLCLNFFNWQQFQTYSPILPFSHSPILPFSYSPEAHLLSFEDLVLRNEWDWWVLSKAKEDFPQFNGAPEAIWRLEPINSCVFRLCASRSGHGGVA